MTGDITALIIDGQQAGKVVEMSRAGRVFLESDEPATAGQMMAGDFGSFTQVVYTPRKLMLFDRVLWIATCKPGWPPAADVAAALLNATALQLFAMSPPPPRPHG